MIAHFLLHRTYSKVLQSTSLILLLRACELLLSEPPGKEEGKSFVGMGGKMTPDGSNVRRSLGLPQLPLDEYPPEMYTLHVMNVCMASNRQNASCCEKDAKEF